jgi:hypothetical protein
VTSILSSISGYFSKSLILGVFLPVVIFIVLSMPFLVPLLPSDLSLFVRFEGIDKEWKVVAVSFVTVVISGLIYNLNIPILRLYEGYPWRNSWIATCLTRRHMARLDAAQNRIEAMRACLRLMETASKDLPSQEKLVKEVIENWKALGSPLRGPGVKEYPWLKIWETADQDNRVSGIKEQWGKIKDDLLDEYSSYRRQVKSNYPDKRGLVLPTRLGNVIRSFEYYSDREYKIDSIALWPRLVGIIPKEYAVAVDDAKTTFDFMMNCATLSLLLAVSMLLAGLIYPAPFASGTPLIYWFSEIAAFALLSYFFYRLSINRASAWGSLVKGAFDLYRWDLLKKLGYEQEPKSREKERDLWYEISRQMIYGDRFDKCLLGYAKEAAPSYPSVRSAPGKAKLEITRGMKTNLGGDVVTFYLRIENRDPNLAEADVIVTDKLSDDFDYEWESAKIDNVVVPVSGTNPYQFRIGNLLRTAEAVLSYNAIPRKKGHNRAILFQEGRKPVA